MPSYRHLFCVEPYSYCPLRVRAYDTERGRDHIFNVIADAIADDIVICRHILQRTSEFDIGRV
jgi:hypothetical protein